jgi:hypothetical protein
MKHAVKYKIMVLELSEIKQYFSMCIVLFCDGSWLFRGKVLSLSIGFETVWMQYDFSAYLCLSLTKWKVSECKAYQAPIMIYTPH